MVSYCVCYRVKCVCVCIYIYIYIYTHTHTHTFHSITHTMCNIIHSQHGESFKSRKSVNTMTECNCVFTFIKLLTAWSRIDPQKLTEPRILNIILRNPQVYKNPTHFLMPSQMNPVLVLPTRFCKITLILFSHIQPGCPGGLFTSSLPTKTL